MYAVRNGGLTSFDALNSPSASAATANTACTAAGPVSGTSTYLHTLTPSSRAASSRSRGTARTAGQITATATGKSRTTAAHPAGPGDGWSYNSDRTGGNVGLSP